MFMMGYEIHRTKPIFIRLAFTRGGVSRSRWLMEIRGVGLFQLRSVINRPTGYFCPGPADIFHRRTLINRQTGALRRGPANAFLQGPAGLPASSAQPDGQRTGIGHPADLPGSFEAEGPAAIVACDRGGEPRQSSKSIIQISQVANPTSRSTQTLPCVIAQACVAKLLPALAADESTGGRREWDNQAKQRYLDPPRAGIVMAGIMAVIMAGIKASISGRLR